ncbi:hypothetical protein HMP0721_1181 [Pseudoramibacter alactolyticus ATCC 23263]|uniref:Uncharacterized protein n=1 Tax=Pseudoramibacter alactolyticus ATCC 23263 TaxID=887929 RepID=E6MGP8_9FIRM|nr:hypothetical protein HMP0721_1181 [Pseudoramibacter alactolyticus ATCC 23263]
MPFVPCFLKWALRGDGAESMKNDFFVCPKAGELITAVDCKEKKP